MNIAIIGRGTSAIITALICIHNGHKITFFFDPNIPHLSVGESTTPWIPKLITEVLGISTHDLIKEGIASYKMGINFVDWGCNKQFYHSFSSGTHAIQFDSKIFNEFIHNNLSITNRATYVAKRIDKVDHLLKDFDFVINCCGWEDKSSYLEPVFKSVNSCSVFKEEIDYYKHNQTLHTLHKATEDGWQFGIPFPDRNILKCGYLFNSEYISDDDVKKKLNKEVTKTFHWEQRYAKEFLLNKNVAINGNRLFFFEPLQALSLSFMHLFANFICDYLREPSEVNRRLLNSRYLTEMWIHQLILAYHYQYGSNFNSEFWNKTSTNAKDMMKYQLNGVDEVLKYNIDLDVISNGNTSQSNIGIFTLGDHIQLQKGLRGEKFLK